METIGNWKPHPNHASFQWERLISVNLLTAVTCNLLSIFSLNFDEIPLLGHTNQSLKLKVFGMNTVLLMTWLHMHLNPKEDSYGPAKTMMVMFKAIL